MTDIIDPTPTKGGESEQVRTCCGCKKELPLSEFWARQWRCKPCFNARRVKDPEGHRRRSHKSVLKNRFGMTVEEYDAMVAAQGGACAICKQPETAAGKTRLSVDHCHESGEVRGLLCSRCNNAIGLLMDNPEYCLAAASYLSAQNSRFLH